MLAFGEFPSLKELLDAVVVGNEQAKRILYEQLKPPFHVFAIHYLQQNGCANSEQDSPEVESSAWSRIFHNIEKLRDHASFFSWAHQIIVNEAKTHLKDCIEKQNEDSIEELQNLPAAEIVPADEVILSNEQLARILALARTIHPKLPAILRLRLIEELDFREIASQLQMSYGNVRTIYSRGLRKLKDKLKDDES